MDNKKLVKFTKMLLDLMFLVGCALTVGIPVIFYYIGSYIRVFREYYLIQCVIYMISGFFCIIIVWELKKMFGTVLRDDAFVEGNAVSLKKMSKCSFIIAALSIPRLWLSPTPATIVILIVFAIAGLFSIVLCQVFQKAIRFKEENDLTI